MSADFTIRTTAEITWDELYSYLLEAVKSLGVEEMTSNKGIQSIWLIYRKLDTELNFDLINAGDEYDFLVQQEREELQIPFKTLITVGVHSHLLTDEEDRLTLEIVCRLAEKWPVVVDNGGPRTIYYANDDLFRLLQERKGFFQ